MKKSMFSGRNLTVGVTTARSWGSGARWTLLAALAGSAVSGCLGDTDDLFPAISAAPGEVPNDVDAPASDATAAGGTNDDASGVPAVDESPTPPGAVDTATEESSGEATPIAPPLDTAANDDDGSGPDDAAPTDTAAPTDNVAPPDEPTPVPEAPPLPDAPSSPASDTEVSSSPRLCASVTEPLLLDFASPGADPTQALFGDFEQLLSGGTYVYPTLLAEAPAVFADPGLLSDVTGGDWHISGAVAQQSGFGVFLDCQLLDASAFAGIAFRVSGRVDGTDTITLLVGTASNDVSSAWRLANGGADLPGSGRCTPATNEYDGTCNQARIDVPVSRQSREIIVPFSALRGGSPEPGVNPAEITTIAWALPMPAVNRRGNVQPYAVDLHIDDIRFVDAAGL